MHLYGLTLAFLLPFLALYAVIAVPSVIANQDLSDRVDSFPPLYDRDGHELGHGHSHGNAVPVVQLNETEVLLHHDPTPPSYWSIDIDDPDSGNARHPSLMVMHSLFMMFAFLGALPAGSSWHHIIASVLIPHDRDCSSFRSSRLARLFHDIVLDIHRFGLWGEWIISEAHP
jgi:hypothetical protein